LSSNGNLRDLFLLRPDVVYLNHGSAGACPRPVFETYQNWQLEYQRQPMEFGRVHGDDIHKARKALAEFIGAEPNNLVYVVNATMGLNIVARSFPLEPGDEVLSTDHEYGSIERTWQFNCAKHGAHYVKQPIPVPIESADQVVEAIWAGVTDRTRVLLFSHIPSPTAWILPAKELVRRAKDAGITTVIDGAHAPGQIDLQLEELGADFYVGDCHKWMTSPTGSAFLYVREEAQKMMEPLIISWGYGTEAPRVTRFVDEHQIQGTRDLSAFLSVPTAIQFMAEHDWPAVRQRCYDLLCYARRELTEFGGTTPLTPEGREWFSQMASIPLPDCDAATLCTYLREQHRVEIPVVQWNGHTMVRVSAQAYNTQEDVDALIQAVKEFFA
jgi:isopenicillin-N epimerase